MTRGREQRRAVKTVAEVKTRAGVHTLGDANIVGKPTPRHQDSTSLGK